MTVGPQEEWDIETQRQFWNQWGSDYLSEATIGDEALRRGEVAISLVKKCPIHSPRILEFGCGNGWLAEKLIEFGPYTGVDVADKMIDEARRRVPGATFLVGDAFSMVLPSEAYDIVVTLEMFAQVLDQSRFVEVMTRALRKGGYLILTMQNRIVYSRRRDIQPQAPGQYRLWLTLRGLCKMLKPRFRILEATTFEPAGDLGFLRIVNSRRLNRYASKFFSGRSINRFKERLGLGQTLVILARKSD
jgi:SAM-dependent methyltransferase